MTQEVLERNTVRITRHRHHEERDRDSHRPGLKASAPPEQPAPEIAEPLHEPGTATIVVSPAEGFELAALLLQRGQTRFRIRVQVRDLEPSLDQRSMGLLDLLGRCLYARNDLTSHGDQCTTRPPPQERSIRSRRPASGRPNGMLISSLND